jgi:hypothetical protein
VAIGFGAVWIAAPGFQLIRVNPSSGAHRLVTGSETSAFDQAAVAITPDEVWASFANDDLVRKIDPIGLTVVDSTHLPRGGLSHELAAGSGHVWATARDPGTLYELIANFLH